MRSKLTIEWQGQWESNQSKTEKTKEKETLWKSYHSKLSNFQATVMVNHHHHNRGLKVDDGCMKDWEQLQNKTTIEAWRDSGTGGGGGE